VFKIQQVFCTPLKQRTAHNVSKQSQTGYVTITATPCCVFLSLIRNLTLHYPVRLLSHRLIFKWNVIVWLKSQHFPPGKVQRIQHSGHQFRPDYQLSYLLSYSTRLKGVDQFGKVDAVLWPPAALQFEIRVSFQLFNGAELLRRFLIWN
jgi:hypothetical protein